ncbi:hypothetical protein ACWCQL_13790 [Streptomyces sp. NPDC002073]
MNPSRLELELIAEVGSRGFTVTATQLERWRQRLWLPRTNHWRTPDGSLRPEIVQHTIALAQLSAQGRSISWAGWTFWALADTPETAKVLREALIAALKRPLDRAGVDVEGIPAGDSNEAFAAREELAAHLLGNRRSPRSDVDGPCARTRPRTASTFPRPAGCLTSCIGLCWSRAHG